MKFKSVTKAIVNISTKFLINFVALLYQILYEIFHFVIVRVVRKRRASQVGRENPPTPSEPGEPIGPQRTTQSHVETNTDDSYQTIDDLLVMKPSFDGWLLFRNIAYFIAQWMDLLTWSFVLTFDSIMAHIC